MIFDRLRSTPRAKDTGIIEDIDKARVMAEAESPRREFLAEFRKYCEDPVAYRSNDNPHAKHADLFMQLYQEGVRASDIEQEAIGAAEDAGHEYDLKEKIKSMSTAELVIRKLICQGLLLHVLPKQEAAYSKVSRQVDGRREHELESNSDPLVKEFLYWRNRYNDLDDEIKLIQLRQNENAKSMNSAA